MPTLRSIALLTVLLAACNQGTPAPSPDAAPADPPAKAPGAMADKRLPPDDPHAEPPPGQKPPEPEVGVMLSTKGTFDVELDGKVVHYLRIPPGQNRAIALPDGTGRVSLGASETESGLPHLRILIEGLRLDQVTLPLTVGQRPADTAEPAEPDAAKPDAAKPDAAKPDAAKPDAAKPDAAKPDATKPAPQLSMRYEVNEHRIYVLDPAKGADVQVTLEAFEGKTLRGRFEGKLAPTAAGLGAPIPISGSFAIELGLSGVEPGASAQPTGGL
jgi:hypothetical protein